MLFEWDSLEVFSVWVRGKIAPKIVRDLGQMKRADNVQLVDEMAGTSNLELSCRCRNDVFAVPQCGYLHHSVGISSYPFSCNCS